MSTKRYIDLKDFIMKENIKSHWLYISLIIVSNISIAVICKLF